MNLFTQKARIAPAALGGFVVSHAGWDKPAETGTPH